MQFVTDFHIHSKYSRATSPQMDIPNIFKWAQYKGIDVVGSGDFTHPAWLSELKEHLVLTDNGFYELKNPISSTLVKTYSNPYMLLSAEVCSIYRKDGKPRKIHNIIIMPDLQAVQRFNKALGKYAKLHLDGRAILNLDALDVLKITLDTSQRAIFIPAHIWTPHYSLFGSASGFDSIRECFEDYSQYISAVETGLSSDPIMNRQLSELDSITLVSSSDAHSLPKLAREATVFDTYELSYDAMLNALRGFKGTVSTIEFFPEEGKYHYDGHRNCAVCLSPEETKNHGYSCPVCGKRLTIGVLHRVLELADKEVDSSQLDFKYLIPLQEILAECLLKGSNSATVQRQYFDLINHLGSELDILLNCDLSDISKVSNAKIAEAISRVRLGQVHISAGYDGLYGKVKIFEDA